MLAINQSRIFNKVAISSAPRLKTLSPDLTIFRCATTTQCRACTLPVDSGRGGSIFCLVL